MGEYRERLTESKNHYPFDRWAQSGLEQYTDEACASFAAVFDQLIETLGTLGEHVSESQKLAAFKVAVEALNALNEEDESLIETGERKELCELCNVVATVTGIDPRKYGDGEGPASEWRD